MALRQNAKRATFPHLTQCLQKWCMKPSGVQPERENIRLIWIFTGQIGFVQCSTKCFPCRLTNYIAASLVDALTIFVETTQAARTESARHKRLCVYLGTALNERLRLTPYIASSRDKRLSIFLWIQQPTRYPIAAFLLLMCPLCLYMPPRTRRLRVILDCFVSSTTDYRAFWRANTFEKIFSASSELGHSWWVL